MSRLMVLVGLVMALAVALPGSTEATSRHQVKKLLASDAEAADIFGWSVAVSGDPAVVGAVGGFGGSGPGGAVGDAQEGERRERGVGSLKACT